MEQIRFQTVITAGLLHDIGKFLQRGDFGPLNATGKHPQVSRDFIMSWRDFFGKFCDVDLLAELVARHHESPDFPPELQVRGADEAIRPLAYIVSRADNYSSAERDDEGVGGGHGAKKTALASVFSRLELDKPAGPAQYYRLARLTPEAAFPSMSEGALDDNPYKQHLKQFGEEFKRFTQDSGVSAFDRFYTRLLNLLQAYTWCVPSSTMDATPDVSLYDHLRTTSAIAAALYRYHEEIPTAYQVDNKVKFRLIVGDLSGIQKHIFRPAYTKGEGGIAKRLRARSFYLSVLVDVVSHMLVQAFQLPVSNIVFSSGGKFYVLAPNTAASAELVQAVQHKVDSELLERFHGQLSLNLADISFSGPEFEDFGKVMAELGRKLAVRKTMPFPKNLQSGRQWMEDAFVFRRGAGLAPCPVCGKVHIEGGECDDCLQDQQMGASLPKAAYISFFRGDAPDSAFPVLKGYAVTLDRQIVKHSPAPYLVYNINEQGRPTGYPELVKHMAKHVPADETGKVLEFDELAAAARGADLLGCLKADVDNLGMLFLHGMRTSTGGRNHASISRVATMSRMLEVFFCNWIEQELTGKEFSHCYTVYSGGDDLLIVGPWDRTFALAGRVNEEFRRFTAANPNLTLSAGLSLFKPRSPIDVAVNRAEQQLENAKETPSIGGDGTSRDQVELLGQTLKWEEYRRVKLEAVRLAEWLEQKAIGNGMVYRLRHYGNMYRQTETDPSRWEFVPMLNYDIARNAREKVRQDIEKWLTDLAQKPEPLAGILIPVTTYALYSNRGGNQRDL